MVELKKYKLRDIFSEFHSGESIKASEIHDIDTFPVFGGNGIRGYCNRYNNDGEYIIIGRQGAYCGNVRYYCGKAFLTEHAIVGKPKKAFNAVYLANKLSIINLSRFQGQSAQPGLAVETLSNVEIDLPTYSTQESIGEVLFTFDKHIETLNAINRNLPLAPQPLKSLAA